MVCACQHIVQDVRSTHKGDIRVVKSVRTAIPSLPASKSSSIQPGRVDKFERKYKKVRAEKAAKLVQ